MRLLILVWAIVAVLSGCASHIPVEIREPVPDAPRLSEIGPASEAFVGRPVRWGGTIVTVENKEDETWVELVAKDLDHYGRPLDSDRSEGRFIARVTAFLDPAIYSEGREITVYGRLEDGIERPIGEKPYNYSVVKAETLYLWRDYTDLYYDDFGYYPYYTYPYPYLYPRYPHHGYYGGYYGDPFWDPFWHSRYRRR
jgi:outer membrane lipoprotein